MNAARLRRMALSGLVHAGHDALWKGLLQTLLQDGSLAASGAWLHLPGHSVQLSDSETQIAQKLLPAIEAGRYDPPWVRDLARDNAIGEETVRQLLRKLARQGLLFQVTKDLFYPPPARTNSPPWCANWPPPPQRRNPGPRLSRCHRPGPQARHPDPRILRPHRLHPPPARRPPAAPRCAVDHWRHSKNLRQGAATMASFASPRRQQPARPRARHRARAAPQQGVVPPREAGREAPCNGEAA